jgi:iron complex transport system ATP-binding protein
MIEASQISVTRDGRRVLENLSLSLTPGELLAVIGPNGAGKSTLLQVLSGALRPSAGEVRFAGKDLQHWPLGELAKVRAVMAQESRLSFDLTVAEVVLLGRHPHHGGWPSQRDGEIARLALAQAGISHLCKRPYTRLSGGERARVQLARTLCQIWEPLDPVPRCLLLDEPTASLDPAQQHLILGVALDFARAGCCVCVVLHDLNLAARYADRIALLQSGKLVALGRTGDVMTEDELTRVYGMRMRVVKNRDFPHPVIVA